MHKSFVSALFALTVLRPVLLHNTVRTNQLFGNTTIGYYYVEVYVGSTQQPQALIVDTGSFTIVFPCRGCSKCGKHVHPYYDYKKSNTFQKMVKSQKYFDWTCQFSSLESECEFYEGYIEGSGYSGFLAVDSLVFKNELAEENSKDKRAIIGCAIEETSEFFKQSANGILGLAPEPPNLNRPPTILQIEMLEKRITRNSFSLCIGRDGGQLGIGGDNNFTHISNNTLRLESSNLPWDYTYSINWDGMKVISADRRHCSQLRLRNHEICGNGVH